MDVIKTLKDIQFLRMEAEYTKNKISELKEKKTSIKSSSSNQVQPGSHVSNPNNDSRTDMMISIELLEEQLEKKLAKVYRLEQQVNDSIDELEPKERIVIKLHYFEGESLERICSVINYSFRHTKRIHREALKKLKTCPPMSQNVL